MLITGRMTFEGSLSGVLGGQALIGCWILLVGLAALSAPDSRRMATFALAGGSGLVATAAGIAFGGMESPLAFAGFVGGLVGTIRLLRAPGSPTQPLSATRALAIRPDLVP